jgi:hypothetical protein
MRRLSTLLSILAVSLTATIALFAEEPVTPTSRPVRLLRSWEETVKAGRGHEYPRRVEVVIDYRKGVAYENFYNPGGTFYGRRKLTVGLLAPSQEEISEAFDIVRADPELSSLAQQFHCIFEGGFALEEMKDKPCGPGSRCLRVFLLSSDRVVLVRQVVVNLVKQDVAYNDYVPPARRIGR